MKTNALCVKNRTRISVGSDPCRVIGVGIRPMGGLVIIWNSIIITIPRWLGKIFSIYLYTFFEEKKRLTVPPSTFPGPFIGDAFSSEIKAPTLP